VLNGPAGSCPIDTIVVICMENRSFDHYFSWLATDERYLEAGRRRYGGGFAVDGVRDLTYLRPDGTEAHPFHLTEWADTSDPYRGCGGHPDPNHGRGGGLVQRDQGFVAQGSGNDDFAIGYYDEADLPCYGQLARNMTVFDRYHASVLASTYPNREYLHSAQSGGHMDNYTPYTELGFTWPTIWDKLKPAGVSGGLYATDIPTTALWGTRLLSITNPIAKLFTDAELGLLPQVTYIDPGVISGERTDDHPHGDIRMAQKWVATVIAALQASPQWQRMAVFVTYDEWGGFYDHVRPPVLTDDRSTGDEQTTFDLTGFRLPVTLTSPFARPGYVDHTLYDHTSILRFIEWRYLGAPAEGPAGDTWWLTSRDRNANNIGAALVDQRINEFVLDDSAVPVVISTPCSSQAFQDVPGASDVEDKYLTPTLSQLGVSTDQLDTELSLTIAPSAFELSRDLWETFGYDTTPSMSLQELLG
jgi:phospholipase C